MLFDPGDPIRATVVFRNTALQATDPTAITVTVEPPGEDVIEYVFGTDAEVVKDATGTYHVDVVGVAGRWWMTFDGSGALSASAVVNFLVNAGAG